MQDTQLPLTQAIQRALAACQRSDWAEAQRICDAILAAQPGQFDALNLLGMIAVHNRRLDEAVELLERALATNPRSAQAHAMRASALLELGRPAQALENLDRAIEISPQSAEIHNHRGLALHRLGRTVEAVESYGRAIAANPNLPDVYNNRGVAQRDLGRNAEALQDYERAIALNPSNAEAHNNRGVVLRELKRFTEALQSYDAAIAIRPDFAEAHSNRGSVLGDLSRHEEALRSQERAIALRPNFADAWVKHGVTLRDLKRHAEAPESFRRALEIDPEIDWLEGMWLHSKMKVCDWSGLDEQMDHLVERIKRGGRATLPFALLAIPSSPEVQRTAAETWARARVQVSEPLPPIPKRPRPPRLRIGYFSADFREHAVAYLVTELLELHDRSSFDVTAFSFGRDTGDAMRKRIEAGVETFIDVRSHSDEEIARLARERGIDIAIDLTGYTEDSRTGIFALRAAPIQASFLGYACTMGTESIDYIVADATIIPESEQRHYTEKLVHLPDSYMPNDRRREISGRVFTRQEQGLPEKSFVFCSFNNSYKILPDVFDSWMRMLARVEGSVLWLQQDSDVAAANLRKEAARRGIDPGRLVFAGRVPLNSEHLARYRLADLFLDTLPFNAHTTASDALWAGLPVLTCLGETYAGRVAASVLRAVGLPELVARTREEYEELAVRIATQPDSLSGIRTRLAGNRLTAPLFDSPRHARHIEDAYRLMFERYVDGLPPGLIRVEPSRPG